jgi:ABC-type branched-subunit amino acid transport system permease subunit
VGLELKPLLIADETIDEANVSVVVAVTVVVMVAAMPSIYICIPSLRLSLHVVPFDTVLVVLVVVSVAVQVHWIAFVAGRKMKASRITEVDLIAGK